eukprot:PITA_30758
MAEDEAHLEEERNFSKTFYSMADNISQLVLRLEKAEERNPEQQGSIDGNGGEEPPPSPSKSEGSPSSHHHNRRNSKDASKKPLFKLDVKFDLPMFNGESNVEKLNNWITQIDVHCKIQQIVEDEAKIQLASLRLSSTALVWWERKLQHSKNMANLNAIHIENRGKNERDDQSRKPLFKPPNGKSKAKWKGKEKKTVAAKEGERPYCNHCKKEGHDDDHCWKQHPEKQPKKYGGKGKQKTMETVQQDLGSDSRDEALIIAAGTKGTLTPHVNSESHESTNLVNESLPNDRKRIELFHIRGVINHTKVETMFDTGSQENLIVESLVNKLGLETKPHPKPYPLGWIDDKAKLNVTKQCKVKFVIAS